MTPTIRFTLHRLALLPRRFWRWFRRDGRLEYTCRVCYDRYHPRGCCEQECPYAK